MKRKSQCEMVSNSENPRSTKTLFDLHSMFDVVTSTLHLWTAMRGKIVSLKSPANIHALSIPVASVDSCSCNSLLGELFGLAYMAEQNQGSSPRPVPPHLHPKLVADYWDSVNGWRWDEFVDFLPNDALKSIASVEILEEFEGSYQNFWSPSSSGKFTIKSALCIIRNDVPSEPRDLWTRLWKVRALQRIRVFAWVVHDRIMSNANRVKRGLTTYTHCELYGADCESSDHILREFPEIKTCVAIFLGSQVWSQRSPG